MKKAISTDKAPGAIGPYSQGVDAGGAVYVSGQLPIDPATGAFVEGGIGEQAVQSIKNIRAILEAAGLTLDNVVKTTVLLADIADFNEVNKAYAGYFTGVCPARSAFQVAALPKGARIEIEAIAVR